MQVVNVSFVSTGMLNVEVGAEAGLIAVSLLDPHLS